MQAKKNLPDFEENARHPHLRKLACLIVLRRDFLKTLLSLDYLFISLCFLANPSLSPHGVPQADVTAYSLEELASLASEHASNNTVRVHEFCHLHCGDFPEDLL